MSLDGCKRATSGPGGSQLPALPHPRQEAPTAATVTGSAVHSPAAARASESDDRPSTRSSGPSRPGTCGCARAAAVFSGFWIRYLRMCKNANGGLM